MVHYIEKENYAGMNIYKVQVGSTEGTTITAIII